MRFCPWVCSVFICVSKKLSDNDFWHVRSLTRGILGHLGKSHNTHSLPIRPCSTKNEYTFSWKTKSLNFWQYWFFPLTNFDKVYKSSCKSCNIWFGETAKKSLKEQKLLSHIKNIKKSPERIFLNQSAEEYLISWLLTISPTLTFSPDVLIIQENQENKFELFCWWWW